MIREYIIGDEYRITFPFDSLGVSYKKDEILTVHKQTGSSGDNESIMVLTSDKHKFSVTKAAMSKYTVPIQIKSEEPKEEVKQPKPAQKRLSKVEFLKELKSL